MLKEDKEPSQKQRIIEAAKGLFSIDGFDNVTIGMISKRAGVSKSTLYCCFENKADILEEIQNMESDMI